MEERLKKIRMLFLASLSVRRNQQKQLINLFVKASLRQVFTQVFFIMTANKHKKPFLVLTLLNYNQFLAAKNGQSHGCINQAILPIDFISIYAIKKYSRVYQKRGEKSIAKKKEKIFFFF